MSIIYIYIYIEDAARDRRPPKDKTHLEKHSPGIKPEIPEGRKYQRNPSENYEIDGKKHRKSSKNGAKTIPRRG